MSLCFLFATVPSVPARYSFPAPAIPMEQPYQKQVLSFPHECVRGNHGLLFLHHQVLTILQQIDAG